MAALGLLVGLCRQRPVCPFGGLQTLIPAGARDVLVVRRSARRVSARGGGPPEAAGGVQTFDATREGTFGGIEAGLDFVEAGAVSVAAGADQPGPLREGGDERGGGGGEGRDFSGGDVGWGVHERRPIFVSRRGVVWRDQAKRAGAVRSSIRRRVSVASGAGAPKAQMMRRGFWSSTES
jgi:hypothetical protein